jgi:chromosomal replication initiation ATPase DnaA
MFSSAARRGPLFYKCEQKRLELLAAKRKQEAIERAIEAQIILEQVEDAAKLEAKQEPVTPLDMRPIIYFRDSYNCKKKIEEIVRIVANQFSVSELELLSQRRTKNVILARHVLYWLCREVTQYSLPEIGRRLMGRDHSTVLHGIRKIDGLILNGDPIAEQCYALRKLWDAPRDNTYWGA